MRDLINKLTLLESSDSNIRKIANYLAYENLFDTVVLTIEITDYYKKTRKNYMSRFFEKNLNSPILFRINYKVNKNTGNLEPKVLMQAITIGDFTRVLHLGEEDPTKEIRRIIINDLKSGLDNSELAKSFRSKLVNMGFTDVVANEFISAIDSTSAKFVYLDKAPQFNEVVNLAYQWRQENIGDL
jgi:hypothetical protein